MTPIPRLQGPRREVARANRRGVTPRSKASRTTRPICKSCWNSRIQRLHGLRKPLESSQNTGLAPSSFPKKSNVSAGAKEDPNRVKQILQGSWKGPIGPRSEPCGAHVVPLRRLKFSRSPLQFDKLEVSTWQISLPRNRCCSGAN